MGRTRRALARYSTGVVCGVALAVVGAGVALFVSRDAREADPTPGQESRVGDAVGRTVTREGPAPIDVASLDPGDLDALDQDTLEPLVHAWLDGRSDEEIAEAMTLRTSFEASDFAGLRDLRSFALDAARIATETDETADGGAGPVRFARYLRTDGTPKRVVDTIGPHDGRLYALFPTENATDDHVLVSWRHEDANLPDVMRRIPVSGDADEGFLWMRPPAGAGWVPGRYRVGIYDDTSPRRLLAQGAYEVRP